MMEQEGITKLDRFMLACLQVKAFEEWLPTAETAEAAYDCKLDRVEVFLECAADIDLLLSIERIAVQQAKEKVGCGAIALWFNGKVVCILRGL